MARINQMIFNKRISKKNKINKAPALSKSPQKSGTCLLIFNKTPRKPNSALRKVAKVKLTNDKVISVYIPGEGHNLNRFSDVLIEGHRIRDLPGVKYGSIRGKLDLSGVDKKSQGRSKYGSKKKTSRKGSSEKEPIPKSRKKIALRGLRRKSRRRFATFINELSSSTAYKKKLVPLSILDHLFFEHDYKRRFASLEKNIEILKDIRFDLRLRPRNYYRRSRENLLRLLGYRKKIHVPTFEEFYTEGLRFHFNKDRRNRYDFSSCRHGVLFVNSLKTFYKSELRPHSPEWGRVNFRKSHLLGPKHNYQLKKDFWNQNSYYDHSVPLHYAFLKDRFSNNFKYTKKNNRPRSNEKVYGNNQFIVRDIQKPVAKKRSFQKNVNKRNKTRGGKKMNNVQTLKKDSQSSQDFIKKVKPILKKKYKVHKKANNNSSIKRKGSKVPINSKSKKSSYKKRSFIKKD